MNEKGVAYQIQSDINEALMTGIFEQLGGTVVFEKEGIGVFMYFNGDKYSIGETLKDRNNQDEIQMAIKNLVFKVVFTYHDKALAAFAVKGGDEEVA